VATSAGTVVVVEALGAVVTTGGSVVRGGRAVPVVLVGTEGFSSPQAETTRAIRITPDTTTMSVDRRLMRSGPEAVWRRPPRPVVWFLTLTESSYTGSGSRRAPDADHTASPSRTVLD
jgi:hypothetical protein